MVIIHELTLDLKKNNTYILQIPQYNKNTHRILVTLTDDGQPFTIPDGFNAYFQMHGQGDNYWLKNATITNNKVQYTLLQSMVGGTGRHSAQIVLSNDNTSSPQQISTFPFYIKVTDAVFSEDTIVHAEQFDVLNNRLHVVDEKIAEAEAVINTARTTINSNIRNGSSTGSLRQISSIAESDYTIGAYAVALGSNTRASGTSSFAVNAGTIAAGGSQTALGSYNIADNNSTYSLIIGNGVDADHRSNAVTVTWEGRITSNGSFVSEGGHFITNYNFVSHSTVTKGQNPSENTFRQFMIQDNTDGDSETNRLAAFRSYVDTEGTSHISIHAYKNEANSVSNSYIRINYPKSGDPYIGLSAQTRINGRIHVNDGQAVVIHQTAFAKGTNPTSTQYAQVSFEDNTYNNYSETHRFGLIRSYVNEDGLSYCGIHAYKNEAGLTSHTYIGAYYPESGDPYVYTPAVLRTGNGLSTGGKTAWNDTTNTGIWLTGASGQIHLSSSTADHGGTISFHFNKSANATSAITEPENGVVQISNKLRAMNTISVVKNDTGEAIFKIKNDLHEANFTTNTNGAITLWSVTNQMALIQMDVDGITKVRCPNGMYRPVGSVDSDGQRVGAFATPSATTLRVYAQKGTAGASYGGYITFTGTSSSDIRLKENIQPVEVDALPLLNAIEMKSFDWKPGERDYTHQPIGMIADQIEKLDERLTIGGGYDPDGTPNYKVIDDHYLVCYLTKGIQELTAENKELRERLEKLESKIK